MLNRHIINMVLCALLTGVAMAQISDVLPSMSE